MKNQDITIKVSPEVYERLKELKEKKKIPIKHLVELAIKGFK